MNNSKYQKAKFVSLKAKILVVEDELTNSILIKRVLIGAGYNVLVAQNGADALKYMEKETFDAVLTDWMMPHIDGIELIRRIRESIKPLPLIIMITALVSQDAREYALEAGADDYIAKPIDVNELTTRVEEGLAKKGQTAPTEKIVEKKVKLTNTPNFPVVVIATSTGGPPTLIEIFNKLNVNDDVAYLIVQHGPPWMLDTFAQRLQKETKLNVHTPSNGMKIEPGNVYVAPGDLHMRIHPSNYTIVLDDAPKENFVRPAADPLFRSAAEVFGEYCLAVVLTGLGRDGTAGASQITSFGGTVLVQDPKSATAQSMPTAVINSHIPHKVVHLQDMAKAINEAAHSLRIKLKSKQ